MQTIYHYTTGIQIPFILMHGLEPRKTMLPASYGSTYASVLSHPIFFGLHEPAPKTWTMNKEFPCVWLKLMRTLELKAFDEKSQRTSVVILLSCDVPRENVYVLERAYFERTAGGGYYSEKEGFLEYCRSCTSLLYYEGDFSIPEFIVTSIVSPKNFKIEWGKSHRDFYDFTLEQLRG